MKLAKDNSLRQAADFLRSLDQQSAATMLGRLSADEAAKLREAIAELDTESSGESSSSTTSDDGTVELQLNATEAVPAIEEQPQAEAFDGAAWLRSLKDADPQAIATYLSREQPRAVAVVLGYLDPELAAGVLQSLAAEEQSRVVAQLAEQREADPDSLRVIATGLAAWVSKQQEEQKRQTDRVATIRRILSATPEGQRRQILNGLAETEPEIAVALVDTLPQPKQRPRAATKEPRATEKTKHPSAPAIAYEQLQRVDGRALAEALGRLDSRSALLSLAAAPDTLLQRLASGLPRKTMRELQTRLLRLGPTTLSEIDHAQGKLAEAVSQIAAERRAARLTTAGGRA